MLASFEFVDQILWCDHFNSRILTSFSMFLGILQANFFLFLSNFWIFALLEVYEIYDIACLAAGICHFRVPSGPLHQNEVKCSSFDMEMSFILMQIKLIFTRKVGHLASFWKWRFLELVSGLLFLLVWECWRQSYHRSLSNEDGKKQ